MSCFGTRWAQVLAPLEPTPGFDVIRNSLPFVAGALARYCDVGLVPTIATFDVGSTRTVAALTDAGVLEQPVLLKIFLWGSPAHGRAGGTSGSSESTTTFTGGTPP